MIEHLGIDSHVYGLFRNVEVGTVYVDAAGLKAVVERQCLMDLAGGVEPDMSVDTAMIRIEIVRVPFKGVSSGALPIVRAVVHLNGQHVLFRAKTEGIGDVDAVSCNSVFIQANLLAIEEYVTGLPHAFEFEKELAAREACRDLEMFAIPREPLVGSQVAAAVRNDFPEGVDVVKTVRSADGRPLRVVEGKSFGAGPIFTDKSPIKIEIEPGARGWRGRETRSAGCRQGGTACAS